MALCRKVLESIPEWFGIEEANDRYISNLESLDGCVVEQDGNIVGFAGLTRYGEYSVEIDVIAVMRHLHRSGIGRMLIEYIELELLNETTKLLHMKTLAPSKDDPNYGETRKFWLGSGFIPMEENAMWGEFNPCLVMVKPL